MFDYRLALMTGADIPIPECQIALHQPTVKEISMIGEKDFFTGIQLLCINKSMCVEDESLLANTTNFQIFMTMMNEKEFADKKENVQAVLTLLFPGYMILMTPRTLVLNKDGQSVNIDEGNFENLQKIIQEIFCLGKTDQNTFNPANKKAKEIADKLMRARQRVAAQQQNSGSMFGQYLSIVTVGIGSMSLMDTIELTMYQLYDLVERYTLYVNWDLDVRARLAGGKPDDKVDNWMKQIH